MLAEGEMGRGGLSEGNGDVIQCEEAGEMNCQVASSSKLDICRTMVLHVLECKWFRAG